MTKEMNLRKAGLGAVVMGGLFAFLAAGCDREMCGAAYPRSHAECAEWRRQTMDGTRAASPSASASAPAAGPIEPIPAGSSASAAPSSSASAAPSPVPVAAPSSTSAAPPSSASGATSSIQGLASALGSKPKSGTGLDAKVTSRWDDVRESVPWTGLEVELTNKTTKPIHVVGYRFRAARENEEKADADFSIAPGQTLRRRVRLGPNLFVGTIGPAIAVDVLTD